MDYLHLFMIGSDFSQNRRLKMYEEKKKEVANECLFSIVE